MSSLPAIEDSAAEPWPKAGPVRQWIGRMWLRVFGWKSEGQPPPLARAVFIAAPHTSNWDLPFMLAVAWSLGLAPSWFGKHTIFRAPFGTFFRALGGIPIDRRHRRDMVRAATVSFEAQTRLYLVISPPGTRKKTPYWKSGFYHIAQSAGVPLCCSFLDYQRKVGGIGPTVEVSGEVGRDMDALRRFYGAVTPKYPAEKSEIRLELEDQTSAAKVEPQRSSDELR